MLNQNNKIDITELTERVKKRQGLDLTELRSILSGSDLTLEQLQAAAAALKQDILSESVTLAALVELKRDADAESDAPAADESRREADAASNAPAAKQTAAASSEALFRPIVAAGHKRLHIILSGDSQTDNTALECAAARFDADHCGCIELTLNSDGAADIGKSADLVFVHPGDLAAYESARNIDSATARPIGVDIDIDCDPESFCRQLESISAAKAFVAAARIHASSAADKTARLKFCALTALALPYAKIGAELDAVDDAVDYVKSGASLLYLRGDATSRTDSVVRRLSAHRILCGFCAACVSCDRYADGYSQLCTDGQLYNYCYLNSLLSLREYAADHASRDTRIAATDLILNRLYGIGNKQVRDQMAQAMKDIRSGERGFRF